MNISKLFREMRIHKEKVEKRRKLCDHNWKNDHEWVYDYYHQTCTKCGSKRLV